MHRLASAIALAVTWSALPAQAAEYYVSPQGSDGNPGTLAEPFATVERAQTAAAPGDTVYIRGGVYAFSGTQATIGVAFSKSGQPDKPIRYFAYAEEVPIFDLFELRPQERVTGLDVRCNWIHLRGLEVRGVRQLIVGDSWGVRIRGDHNVIERLNVHDCEAPGVFITSGASNLILNSDSHHNYDPLEDGGNADGFGCHSDGGDNVLRGCRAYENSDDGFDFINAPGTCTVEGSWSFRNGFVPGTHTAAGNGGGFKSGGFGEPPNTPARGAPRHVVRFNVAFDNRAIGIYANHHPGGIDFLNNTAFDNPANFDMRTAQGQVSSHKLRNNLAAGAGRAIVNFNGGSDDINAWTLPVTVTSADFLSMDKAQALAPRQADGNLPNQPFMRLVDGSDLIDRGEDLGFPFTGEAPDLGAYEWSLAMPAQPGPTAGTPAGAPGADAGVSQPTAAGDGAPVPPFAPGPPLATTPAEPPAAQPTAANGGASQPPQVTPAGGCGCRVGAPRRPTRAALLLFLAGMLGTRARTRRRRTRSARDATDAR